MNNSFRVYNWAKDKGLLDDCQPLKQLGKTQEELTELRDEVLLCEQKAYTADFGAVKEELGDVLVTLNVLACQLGLNLDECLGIALDKIEKRSGKMVNGTFVKD